MKNVLLLGAVCVAALLSHSNALAQSPRGHHFGSKCRGCSASWAESQPWHGQYYYTQYGQPTALVVPPTAVMQQNYSWGVSQNTMTPIYQNFGPSGMPSAGGAFYATPRWPSNTNQFGVYPVRGPW